MSGEKGQEGLLAAFQDTWALHVSQTEQQGDKLGKYGPAWGWGGKVQMLN